MVEPKAFQSHSIQFLTSAALWVAGLFIPSFARLLGASDAMIGLIGAGYGIAIFSSSYFFGVRADVEGALRYLRAGLLLGSISVAMLAVAHDPVSLLLLYFVAGISLGMYPAALVAYAYRANVSIGRFSALGSLGWTAGLFIAGLVATLYALRETFLLSALLFFMAFALLLALPGIGHIPLRVPLLPVALVKRNFAVVSSFLLRHTGGYSIWIIFPLYLAQLGADYFWISVIYAVNSFGQFIIMGFLTERFRSLRMIEYGLVLSALTFLLYPHTYVYWQVIPVQALLASSWSFLYVGSLRRMVEANPERATAVGLLNSTINLSTIVGSFAGGLLSQVTGSYRPTMYFASAMSIAGFVLFRISSSSSRA